MSHLLHQKVAWITGAGSGIGYGIARSFAKEGAAVILTDIREESAQAAAAAIRDDGGQAVGMKCDVTREDEVRTVVSRVVSEYGAIHILINNAGLQHVAPIEDFPVEMFETLIKVMLTGAFICIKHAFPVMKLQGDGRIINMASINGVVGFAGKSAYNSAKHGLIGLTKVAALEGAKDGITVNALCPGYVDTPLVRGQLEDLARTRSVEVEHVLEEVILPLVPQHRLLSVEEVADYAVLIASDRLRGVTGATLLLDGGYTAQ
ncbi:3-hydroxybutyrate dehydrogenase [Paenibacillus whitsoniae]|uniref:3-hydroxybutyrate dehydrogenase n=1 Tax=Paenibacillus whitsoniae TaxID=2496558 RepID=A0A430JIA2_9BACL|nr:3-hydroxybutyrate dehydrogenase [Paenibacillus whitsoniae]